MKRCFCSFDKENKETGAMARKENCKQPETLFTEFPANLEPTAVEVPQKVEVHTISSLREK